MEDNMEDLQTDEAREARRWLATAFETLPTDPATAGDGLLRAVRRRYALRRRNRALVQAGGAAAVAGTAAAVLLSVTVTGAPPALAAVTGALSRAAAGSFRMDLVVTQRNTVPVPGEPAMSSPLYITGELDLKRNLGEETLSNGWRTLIVGRKAYTKLLPSQTKAYGTGGRLWMEEPLWQAGVLPFRSTGAQLAWDLNSDRPFNPQALIAVLRSTAKVLDEGPASGPGWSGTRYRFSLSHPDGTGGVVDGITCTVDVDSHGQIRSLVQTTVFVASGKPGTPGETICTLAFTFSDFGARFSVIPPPASQVDPNSGVAIQF
jgi:hypothetical protein